MSSDHVFTVSGSFALPRTDTDETRKPSNYQALSIGETTFSVLRPCYSRFKVCFLAQILRSARRKLRRQNVFGSCIHGQRQFRFATDRHGRNTETIELSGHINRRNDFCRVSSALLTFERLPSRGYSSAAKLEAVFELCDSAKRVLRQAVRPFLSFAFEDGKVD